MLKARVIEAVGETRALVFLLHGRGADSSDLVPLAEALAFDNVRYVLPDGAQPLEGSLHGRQWYAFGREHGRDLEASNALLSVLIDCEAQAFAGARLAIVGFSQGAVLALDVGLKRRPPPAALIGLSGYLYELPEVDAAGAPAVLLVHGSADAVIPVSAGRQAYQTLLARGLDVRFEEFAMGHQINVPALEAVRRFLALTLFGT